MSFSFEKARELQKNIYFCFIDYAKAFDSGDSNKLWEILKEMHIPDQFTYFLRNPYAGKETAVRAGHGKTDWSQLGKEYDMAVYWLCAYLIYIQNTSCEMPDWMNHKESRLLGEMTGYIWEIASQIYRWYHSNSRKMKRNERASWWRWKRRVKKLA